MFRNFKMVSKVVFGRGCFSQLGDILQEKRLGSESVTIAYRRTRNEMEYELLDTGVFAADRYFDVFVEYAKAGRRAVSHEFSSARASQCNQADR